MPLDTDALKDAEDLHTSKDILAVHKQLMPHKHCENNAEESAHFYTCFNNVLHQARDLCCAGTGVSDSQFYAVSDEAISLLWYFVFLDVFPEQERQSVLVRKSKLTSAKRPVAVGNTIQQHRNLVHLKVKKYLFTFYSFVTVYVFLSECNCSVKNHYHHHIAKCEQLVIQWKLCLGV